MYRIQRYFFNKTFCFCVFIVCWREINLVAGTKHDDLEFWNPKTEATHAIDARRTESHRHSNRIDRFIKPGHHAKNNDKANGTMKEALRADRHRTMEKGTKEALRTPNGKRESSEKVPHGIQSDVRWPRVHRNKKKEAKSTRMTPPHQMQQEKERDHVYSTSDTTQKATPFISGEHRGPADLSPYSITRDILDYLAAFPYVNITKEVIGRTIEYNDILLLRMSEMKGDRHFRAEDSKYIDEIPEKKIIFIVHGLSVMGMYYLRCMYAANLFQELLSYYVSQVDKFDIYFIPMANPDGFLKSAMYWNKNMSPQNACPGVALDRNFDIAWNMTKEISSCSQMYPGPSPFSELETRAIRDTFHQYSHKIVGYLHVHAGSFSPGTFKGDAVLFPKGYTDIQTDDDKYIDLKGEIDEALKNASFRMVSVTVDTLYNWYGKISGSSVDYASSVYGIPYAMELVMQLYEGDISHSEVDSVPYKDYALTELWKPVIDVIFSHIWRNTHGDNNNSN